MENPWGDPDHMKSSEPQMMMIPWNNNTMNTWDKTTGDKNEKDAGTKKRRW